MIKWLVRLGSAVGLLLIAFVGVMVMLGGGRHVSRHTEAQIEIDRPAAAIFPFLTDGPSLLKWIQGMESFQTTDELQGRRTSPSGHGLGGRRHRADQ
jgi:hypothetical protein